MLADPTPIRAAPFIGWVVVGIVITVGFLVPVVPAGFVSGVPVRLFTEFEWRSAGAMVTVGRDQPALGLRLVWPTTIVM